MPDKIPYVYKDFVTGGTRRTFGVFDKWEGPTGPLNAYYAIFKTRRTFVCVPEYCLTPDSRQRLPPRPERPAGPTTDQPAAEATQ